MLNFTKTKQKEFVIILHNLRSAYNVGAIFRTADAVQVSKIYLTGYTSAPKDRFGRKQKEIAKVALGAEDYVKWEKHPDLEKLINQLKNKGYTIVALEQDKSSIYYKKIKDIDNNKIALVLGNEPDGLSEEEIKLADYVAEIPMLGKKESLNVAAAFAVAVYGILDI